MNRILILLFALALPAFASPAANKGDLKNLQQSITLDANGIPQSYSGILVLGGGSINPTLIGLIGNASLVIGTITDLVGGSLTDNGNFATASSITVTGQQGQSDEQGGGAGADSVLTEGPHITCEGHISGGNAGIQFYGGGIGAGGGGELFALPATNSKTYELTVGGDNSSVAGGGVQFNLASSRTSLTLTFTLANPNTGSASIATVVITGASLSTLTLTLTATTWSNYAGPSIDISGTVANDASQDALVLQCQAMGMYNGTLNMGGTCAAVSGGTQTDIDNFVASNFWTVFNN